MVNHLRWLSYVIRDLALQDADSVYEKKPAALLRVNSVPTSSVRLYLANHENCFS
jgi:hypothetical protein